MTKSSWSLRMWLTAAVVLLAGQQLYGQATLVTATSGDSRAPVVVNTPGARIPNIATGKDFDTSLTSTDYYTFEPVITQGPNPDVAVGPDDIIAILGKKIARFKNPNAITPNPDGLSPDNASGSGWVTSGGILGEPTSEVFMDVWLGGETLNRLCPPPRTNASCVISNASVRYDQMQGRFLVLFTVVDTGAIQGAELLTGGPATNRRASWALVVSKYASLVVEADQTTDIFTSPQPPAIIGGVNPANWTLFTSTTAETTAPLGNINSISAAVVTSGGGGAPAPDCTALATAPCYIPTDARIGIDNDNIVITATVFDDNVPIATRTAANTYKGTRVRVYKKDSLYRAAPPNPLVAGNSYAAPQVQGDYYDLFDTGTAYTIHPWNAEGGLGMVFEPEHLRGRSLASFSGNGNLAGQVSYLLGTEAGPAAIASNLTIRRIDYSATTVASNNLPNNPGTALLGGIPTLNQTIYQVPVPNYTSPGLVPQANAKTTPAGSATLYVGDARPRRVIAREGVLYDARTALEIPNGTNGNTFNPTAQQVASVVYDLVSTNRLANQAAPVNPYLVYRTSWGNGNFWAPMFDVPANVLTYGAMSPVNILPFLEKLFVAGTYGLITPGPGDLRGSSTALYGTCRVAEPSLYTATNNWAGLFDIRCGEDNFDTAIVTADPYTGLARTDVYYAARGGSSPDPNDLSMWLFGAYTKGRQSSILGYGQFGTHMSNYSLSFPTVDPYGNGASTYTDVTPGHQYFPFIQIARQTEIVPGGRAATTFSPEGNVNRAEMAYWVVRAQMDEQAITSYLNNSGGATCSFADVGCPGSVTTPASGPAIGTAANSPLWWRYIEVMYRRGYTKGCQATNDVVRRYCPADNLTRGQMSVFLIRAKMDSVHLTVTSGTQPGLPAPGDLFSMRYPSTPYFTDVPATHDYFRHIQKMRELRITIGTGTGSTYGPDEPLTRGQIAVFLVRAFFI